MWELRQHDATIGYRFLAMGPCVTQQCCFGGGGPHPPGGGVGVPVWIPVRRCGDDTQTGAYVQWSNINTLGRYFLLNEECVYVDPFDAAAITQATAPGTEITAHSGVVANCADALCAGPVCTSPVGSAVYKIDNYTPGSFFNVSGCSSPDSSGRTEWLGTFPWRSGNCIWHEDENGLVYRIQGCRFDSGSLSWQTGSGGYWDLTLDLVSSIINYHKAYGPTPAGRYTRQAGSCSPTPTTIDIIPGP